jgi:hypothetical protein
MFCFSSVYAALSMPYISPESLSDAKKDKTKGVDGLFAPLKVLSPQTLRLSDGTVRKHYGVFFLCCGVFMGVVSCLPHRPRLRLTFSSSQQVTGLFFYRCTRLQSSTSTKTIMVS